MIDWLNQLGEVCYTKWQSNKLTVPSRMSMPRMPLLQSFAPLVADCLQRHNVNLANENVIEMDVDEVNEDIDGNGNADSISNSNSNFYNINSDPHDSNEVDVAGYVLEDDNYVNDLPPVFIQSNDKSELF